MKVNSEVLKDGCLPVHELHIRHVSGISSARLHQLHHSRVSTISEPAFNIINGEYIVHSALFTSESRGLLVSGAENLK